MSSTPDPETFRAAMLRFANEILAKQEGKRPFHPTPISADTPLFETQLLDSLSILQLIGAIERLTGRLVTDEFVTMKNFRSIETITSVFCHGCQA
jgi:acyl carrier protein